jgi:regulator of protease activity HflC (stomatin/prohibitin superfamily)
VETLLKFDDPIKKMYDAMLADGRSIGDSISTELIRAGKQSEISAIFGRLDAYCELGKAAEQCGFNITSVRLTDLKLGEELEQLIKNEKKSANRIQIEMKEKNQRREIRKLEMEDKKKEINDEAELESMKLASDDQLEKESHEMSVASMERKLALQMMETQSVGERDRMKDEATVKFLKDIKSLDVDVTKFLISAYDSKASAISKRACISNHSDDNKKGERYHFM